MHETEITRRTLKHGSTTWVDLESPSPEALAEVERAFSLQAMHVRESLQKVQHVEVEREPEYLFLVLHVPILTTHTDKIHTTQVGVFLGKNFLVTIRSGAAPFITDLFEVCSLSADKAEQSFKPGSAQLFCLLVNNLLGDISDMTDDVNNELDAIEDLVFDTRDSDGNRIAKVRQKIVRLGRVIGPKRLLLQDLAEQVATFFGSDVARYYTGNVKLANKLWEEVEEAKETVEVYKDADFTASTEQTNRILAVLTLVFTFTIPVTVAGTLYGMNVLIPGGTVTGEWTFLGRYTTFLLVVSFSALVALAMYLYFKARPRHLADRCWRIFAASPAYYLRNIYLADRLHADSAGRV
jgi:magnesium transporter